jgi:hypothetical protein
VSVSNMGREFELLDYIPNSPSPQTDCQMRNLAIPVGFCRPARCGCEFSSVLRIPYRKNLQNKTLSLQKMQNVKRHLHVSRFKFLYEVRNTKYAVPLILHQVRKPNRSRTGMGPHHWADLAQDLLGRIELPVETL